MRPDTDWLPASGPPPRRRRIGRLVGRTVAVVLCFAIGVALAFGALVWQGGHELIGTRIALDTLGQPPVSEGASEPQGLSEAKTVLLVGDDSADDLSPQFRGLATGERAGHRTDTIMVLRIDPQGGKITGINFPRDMLVTLCDGSRQRINAALFVGGPDCLVETVRDVSGVRIDHFVQVNFEGFVKIVNAVEGVPIYLEEPMRDQKAHVDLPKGCVVLDGRSALGFVRTRLDNDFGRIARQQRFLKELADRATSLSVLANPVRVFQLVDSMGELLTVDDGLSLSTMRQIALTLRNVESDDISLATIPTATDSSTGVFYEIPIDSQMRPLLTAFKADRLAEYLGEEPRQQPAPAASASAEPRIPLDELPPVSVLNASNVSGLAAATAEALEGAEVPIGSIADADRPEPDGVMIAYPSGQLTAAESLQTAAFPDAVLELDDTVDGLAVIVPSDLDPDAITVRGASTTDAGEDGGEGSTARSRTAPQRPEYTNAQPVENRDC